MPVPDVELEDPRAGLHERLDLLTEARKIGRVDRRLDLDLSNPVLPAHTQILSVAEAAEKLVTGHSPPPLRLHFQKLEPGATGVTVAKVESGSKSDVAKLAPLSIIVRVNEVAVKDLAHFRQLAASPKGLTLTTILFGQTKLVELPRE